MIDFDLFPAYFNNEENRLWRQRWRQPKTIFLSNRATASTCLWSLGYVKDYERV